MAGTSSIGRLTLDLVVKAGAFLAGMTAAERQANKSLTAIEKRAYKFGNAIGAGLKAGAVLATAAVTALSVAVGQAIDNADSMRDLSIRTGIATEKLSEYAYAAKQTGTDIDGLSRGLKLFSKNIAEAADSGSGKGKLFSALGIEVKDAHGNLRQLDDLLPEVADRFKSLEDGTTKAALAQELFGKSGADLIEFLNSGSDGLEQFANKARELGIIITQQTADGADEFKDKLGDLKAIAAGVTLQIASGLLPQLNESADRLKELAQEGDLAGNAITVLSAGLRAGVGAIELYNRAVASLSIEIERVVNSAKGLATVSTAPLLGYIQGGTVGQIGRLVSGIKQMAAADAEAAKQWDKLNASASKATANVLFSDSGAIPESMLRKQSSKDNGLESRLAGYLGGEANSGGKSKAASDADQLKAAYDRMNESLNEQIALFGKTGEAAQLRYELESGELAKLAPAQKQELIAKAEKLDQMRLEQELQEAADKAAREESDRIYEGIRATDEFIDQLKFELELMSMTNAERERAIALRHLDANATDEQRKAVGELVDQMTAEQDKVEVLDEFRHATAGLFEDLASGSKSAKEAFGDFVDAIVDGITRIAAQKLAEQLFGSMGSSDGGWLGSLFGGGASASGGASGGGFIDWLGSLWGGGKAIGGAVQPWSLYEVNERGMEGLSVGGRDYLLTGSRSGYITPANRMGGRAFHQTNNIVVQGRPDRRTPGQVAIETGQAARREMSRTG